MHWNQCILISCSKTIPYCSCFRYTERALSKVPHIGGKQAPETIISIRLLLCASDQYRLGRCQLAFAFYKKIRYLKVLSLSHFRCRHFYLTYAQNNIQQSVFIFCRYIGRAIVQLTILKTVEIKERQGHAGRCKTRCRLLQRAKRT